MGYLDCSCERKHTFIYRERETPGELTAFFSFTAGFKHGLLLLMHFIYQKGDLGLFACFSLNITVSFTIFVTVTVV